MHSFLSRQLAIARRDDLMRDAARAFDAPRSAAPGSSVAQFETESTGRRRAAHCTEACPTSVSAAAPLRIMTAAENELRALMATFLQAVSFEPGAAPEYASIRELFTPHGLLINDSGERPEVSGVEAFIAPRQALVDSGALTAFKEVEVGTVTEIFGNIAHRFHTYEKRGTLDGVASEAVGMIPTQFIRTPGGWKITVMAWDDVRAGLNLPERYRPATSRE
jgi:hypothetical protein